MIQIILLLASKQGEILRWCRKKYAYQQTLRNQFAIAWKWNEVI
jgi:hypothetical protein